MFIHCGRPKIISPVYVGHWGGITFSTQLGSEPLSDTGTVKKSVLRHVEIVGAGFAHNDLSPALEAIYHSVILDNVNVTNSSMDGISIVAPKSEMTIQRVNVSHNLGIGLNVLTLNLQGDQTHGNPLQNITFPYFMYGLLDFCSVEKEVIVEKRILAYYKYDSRNVDCLKIFRSRHDLHRLAFRFLQANLYDAHDDSIGRQDELEFYSSDSFLAKDFITKLRHNSDGLDRQISTSTSTLAIECRKL